MEFLAPVPMLAETRFRWRHQKPYLALGQARFYQRAEFAVCIACGQVSSVRKQTLSLPPGKQDQTHTVSLENLAGRKVAIGKIRGNNTKGASSTGNLI